MTSVSEGRLARGWLFTPGRAFAPFFEKIGNNVAIWIVMALDSAGWEGS